MPAPNDDNPARVVVCDFVCDRLGDRIPGDLRRILEIGCHYNSPESAQLASDHAAAAVIRGGIGQVSYWQAWFWGLPIRPRFSLGFLLLGNQGVNRRNQRVPGAANRRKQQVYVCKLESTNLLRDWQINS